MPNVFNDSLTRINEIRKLGNIQTQASKFTVESFYSDYLRALVSRSIRSISASQLLVQLQIVNSYHLRCIAILGQKDKINQLPSLPEDLCNETFNLAAAEELNTLLNLWPKDKSKPAQADKNIELDVIDPNIKIAALIAPRSTNQVEISRIINAITDQLEKAQDKAIDLNATIDPDEVYNTLHFRRV